MKATEIPIGTIFTNAELNSAYEEMQRERTHLSSVERNGVVVGSTSVDGSVFATYDKTGIFIGTLNFAWGDTFDGRLDSVVTPVYFFGLEGTELEAEAISLSRKLASIEQLSGTENELAYDLIRDQIVALQMRVRHKVDQ